MICLSPWLVDKIGDPIGLEVGTVAMTFAAPVEKLEGLRTTRAAWLSDWAAASNKELRGLIGKLLHLLMYVYGGGNRKILRTTYVVVSGVTPVQDNKFAGGTGARQIPLEVESHAGLAFWLLLIKRGSDPCGAPLIWSFFHQPPTYTP